jgi:predicted lipoprotein with Yx(FWY)xxD motif
MKKGSLILIGVIIVAIVVIGGFALFHKSNNSTSAPQTATSDTNTPAVNNAVLVTKTSSSLGKYLAEPNGQPLYTYNDDHNGKSTCTGACLATWPAYQDKGSTTGLPAGVSTIRRTDNGQVQYTYNGMPLYTFVNDSHGQVTGNGVENFTIAKPAAAAAPASNDGDTSNNSSSNSSYPY